MKREINKRALVLVLFLFLAVALAFFAYERQDMAHVMELVDGEVLSFSLSSGFYEETVQVKLTKDLEIPSSAKIYYTLNGDDPTVDAIPYAGSVVLEARSDGVTLYPLKAVVYYKGAYSPVVERTYLVGAGVGQRFTLPVISITSSHENLYDPETGIMVHYDERDPEWERQSHVTMFDASGQVMVDQGVGLAVFGGTSARKPIKSLKLVADAAYDQGQDRLNLRLFEDVEQSPLSFVETYNNVRLRAGSQDREMGNIRSAVMSRLASQSNFYGCSTTQRCVVYVNGEYWGVFDLQQNFTRSFIRRRFGLPNSDEVFTIKPTEYNALYYGEVYSYFQADLNVPENREVLEQYVDMDDYLLYCALEILANNTDWPQNNFMMWRYTGQYDPNNPYTDGRYRFLVYDTDMIFHPTGEALFFEGADGDTFRTIMAGTGKADGTVLPHVLESEYYRSKFLTMVADLLNTSFREENVLALVDTEYDRIRAEAATHSNAEELAVSDQYVQTMKLAITEREENLRQAFAELLGAQETYGISLQNAEGVTLSWNQMALYSGEGYENAYYCGTNFVIHATADPGYVFSHWLVNGQRHTGEDLVISDALAVDGTASVVAVSQRVEGAVLGISELSAEGGNDWVKITNFGGEAIWLENYWLSDDQDDVAKYQLPGVMLAAGESVVINCKNNAYAVGDYISNFSLKQGETLYLWQDMVVIDRVTVPAMADGESYGRRENSAQWVYYRNGATERK